MRSDNISAVAVDCSASMHSSNWSRLKAPVQSSCLDLLTSSHSVINDPHYVQQVTPMYTGGSRYQNHNTIRHCIHSIAFSFSSIRYDRLHTSTWFYPASQSSGDILHNHRWHHRYHSQQQEPAVAAKSLRVCRRQPQRRSFIIIIVQVCDQSFCSDLFNNSSSCGRS